MLEKVSRRGSSSRLQPALSDKFGSDTCFRLACAGIRGRPRSRMSLVLRSRSDLGGFNRRRIRGLLATDSFSSPRREPGPPWLGNKRPSSDIAMVNSCPCPGTAASPPKSPVGGVDAGMGDGERRNWENKLSSKNEASLLGTMLPKSDVAGRHGGLSPSTSAPGSWRPHKSVGDTTTDESA